MTSAPVIMAVAISNPAVMITVNFLFLEMFLIAILASVVRLSARRPIARNTMATVITSSDEKFM
jgi:hypothetical protein